MSITRNGLLKIVCFLFIVCFVFFFAACSPQGADSETKEGPQESITQDFAWSTESDCNTCHPIAVESFSNPACVASQHKDLAQDCFSCHTDKEALTEAHASVTLDSKKRRATLKKTDVPESACTTCHPKDEIMAATTQSTVLTDSNGKTVNPHDLPQDESHADISCADCHKLHSEEPASEVAPEVCTNCHHANVYECGTCHD